MKRRENVHERIVKVLILEIPFRLQSRIQLEDREIAVGVGILVHVVRVGVMRNDMLVSPHDRGGADNEIIYESS